MPSQNKQPRRYGADLPVEVTKWLARYGLAIEVIEEEDATFSASVPGLMFRTLTGGNRTYLPNPVNHETLEDACAGLTKNLSGQLVRIDTEYGTGLIAAPRSLYFTIDGRDSL